MLWSAKQHAVPGGLRQVIEAYSVALVISRCVERRVSEIQPAGMNQSQRPL